MLPPAQIDVLLALTETAGITWLIVIVTGALVTVGVVTQFALLVISTVTTSPLTSVADENVAFVASTTGLPLMNHWYVGANPPSVAVVVNVTVVPWHTPFWSGAIDTVGVTLLVVIFTGVLVAVVGFAQASLLVN